MWSDREMDEIQERLAPSLKRCSVCNASDFGVWPDVVALPTIDLKRGPEGYSLAMVAVTCQQCAATILFHAPTLRIYGAEGMITVGERSDPRS